MVTSGIGRHGCTKDSESDSSALMNGRALPGFPFLFFIGENGTNAEFKVLIRAKLLLR